MKRIKLVLKIIELTVIMFGDNVKCTTTNNLRERLLYKNGIKLLEQKRDKCVKELLGGRK